MGMFRKRTTGVVPEQLDELRQEGARVIDVRSLEEWNAGHLEMAEHVPLEHMAEAADRLEPDRLTVFVCRSGHRSAAASQAFEAAGFRVANLSGGLLACGRSGMPVVRNDGSPGRIL